jgi:nitroreductase
MASPSQMTQPMLKSAIFQRLQSVENRVAPLFSSFRWLTRLYYAIVSPRFSREQWTVLRGRDQYRKASHLGSRPLLRRNIHRLEKGLVMRPRQPVFAEDYIAETVEALIAASRDPASDVTEVQWATDVIGQYFEIVTPTPIIDEARAAFTNHTARGAQAAARGERLVPYPRSIGISAHVSFESFMDLCRQRRSVRWFLPEPVPLEIVEKAIAAAAEAPSACNRQPFLFRFFDCPAEAAKIASIAIGTSGYAEQIPALLVVLGDFSSFEHERDRHLPYIDGALASMQLMLALETLGLSSCAINWPDIEARERNMATALELAPHLRPLMLIAVGYADPDGGIPRSAKKNARALLRTSNLYH